MSAPLKSAPVSERSEIEAGWQTTKRVAPFLWPVGNFDLRARVVLALLALVATKFIAILAPILQAWAVDDLAGSGVPAKLTLPMRGCRRPVMTRAVVDLPLPDSPTTATVRRL